jgi:hypothetical protein
MSNTADLTQLELDVVEARKRLVQRVDDLRKPDAFARARSEINTRAHGLKDDLVDQTKEIARGQASMYLEDLKERARANPAAMIAIGGGVAWHLYRHPPISTLLIGAGLYSLFRGASASPIPRYEPYASARPSSYVPGGIAGYGYPSSADAPGSSVTERVRATLHDATVDASNLAVDVQERISDAASSLANTTRATAHDARDLLSDTRAQVVDRVKEGVDRVRQFAGDRLSSAGAAPANDLLLLGIAAAAIGAAVAVSRRRADDIT